MAKHNAVEAIYQSHAEAEAAVKELQRSGFDMKKLSIVGRDQHTEEHVVGFYNAGDRMKYWGKLGAFGGGMWGMMFGSATFLIPGLGPLLVTGPLAGWITMDRLPETGDQGFYLKQQLNNKLIEYKQYIDKNGKDLPEVRSWKWSNSK
ncbi:MAG: general stress protein [Verrucomicrobiota bacterium]